MYIGLCASPNGKLKGYPSDCSVYFTIIELLYVNRSFMRPMSNTPVSLVLALPVYICRKSWYSFVSLTCNLVAEYMFIVEKKDTSSSNSPIVRAPEFARMSPNLSHVQCGKTMGLTSFPPACTRSLILSSMSLRNWWNVLLHLPR